MKKLILLFAILLIAAISIFLYIKYSHEDEEVGILKPEVSNEKYIAF